MILTIAAPHRLLKDPELKLYDSNYCSENAIFIAGSRKARLFCTLYLTDKPTFPLTSSIFAEQKREEDPRRSSKPISQSIESRM